ncbi:MotE family protein [Salipiger mucosus]|nr:hypothetical protein [Salipiger mucosus]
MAKQKPPERQKKKSGARRRGRGVLRIIGGLLVASALVRLGSEAGAALALDTDSATPPAQAAEDPPARETTEPEHEAPQDNRIGADLSDEELGPLLEALRAREERIAKREAAMRTRAQALKVAETEIDRKMAALTEAEKRLRATLSVAQDAAEQDVERLTQVYANMKPKQAAALFERMDPEFAAGFLGRMRPDAAAAIMAGLSPEQAYTVSVTLAGRNADVPKE